MIFNVNRSLQEHRSEYERLESKLEAALRPVSPRPEFTDHLKTRLSVPPPRSSASPNVLQIVLLSTAGFISGLVLLIAGVRKLRLMRQAARSEAAAQA